MQILFENEYKDGKKTGIINFIPNYGILPNHKEIDAIVDKLLSIKKGSTNEEIEEYNEKTRKENEKTEYTSIQSLYEKDTSGIVYVLKSEGLYKIGRTKNLKNRLKSYETQNPHKMEVIIEKEVENCFADECCLLEMFKDKKIKGRTEWFKLSLFDIEEIKEYLNYGK